MVLQSLSWRMVGSCGDGVRATSTSLGASTPSVETSGGASGDNRAK